MSFSVTITVVFTAAYLLVTGYHIRGLLLGSRELTLCGVCIGLTVVLECIYIPLPTGSGIPLASMLPFMILAVYDDRLAMLGGFVTGLVCMLFVPGWQPVHWGQFFVEHLVCFSCIGYTGIFGTTRKKLLAGALLASGLKIIGHVLSGVLFFSQNAWDGWGAWGYSLGYNLSSSLPLGLICTFLLLAIPEKTMQAVIGKRGNV